LSGPTCPCGEQTGEWVTFSAAVCVGLLAIRFVRRRMKGINEADESYDKPQSLFDGEAGGEKAESPESTGGSWWWKVIIVLALLVAVGVAIVARKGSQKPGTSTQGRGIVSSAPERAQKEFPSETVVATVNGQAVTAQDLREALERLPAQYRANYEHQKQQFLEEVIARKLLLQEARAVKIADTEAYRKAVAEHEAHPGHEEHVLIDVLLQKKVFDKVQVSDADLRAFYEAHKEELSGRPSFEKARDLIRPSVEQQRQYEALDTYLAGLKKKAKITRNEEWIEAQKKAAADNPLDQALRSGKPVLADFGRGACIPCKMMKPILDKLGQEFKERIHVLILDTGEYGYLARRFRIRVIPTQIFFSAAGEELFRHEGFMSREDILAKFKELQMTPR